jgi:ribosome maturation factor RimP
MDKSKLDGIYSGLRERVESMGYDCVGFELAAEDGLNILRVYADMPGGVSLSDCELIARGVNEYLDENESSLPEKYFLEVSSPGLERPLFTPEDYSKFEGKDAKVDIKGGKSVTGIIKGTEDDNNVHLLTSEGEVSVKFTDIKRGKLIYKEQKGQKKTFKKIPKPKKK